MNISFTLHISLLEVLASIPAALYVFWWLFLGVAALYSQWHTGDLPLWLKLVAAPGALCALLFDFVFNNTLGTVLFWQFSPRRCYTFTQRLSWYKNTHAGWRGQVASIVCTYFLNPFQVGGHCR